MTKKNLKFTFLLTISFGLFACGNADEKRIIALTDIVQKNISTLENKIANKELRNIKILNEYISTARELKPERIKIINILAVDATIENPNFEGFKSRFQDIQKIPTKKEQVTELISLNNATTSQIYNEMLVDTINVISDLTDGQLPKFMSNQQGEKTEPGSNLVGNTAYGRWNNNNGQNIWAWYGAYRIFGDLMGRSYYHRWYYDRPWSYYNDYGRGIYGGNTVNQKYNNLRQSNDRQIKQYGQSTGRNPSSYAKRTNTRFAPSNATTRARSSVYSATQRSGSRSSGKFAGK